jgi:putative phosphoesterase
MPDRPLTIGLISDTHGLLRPEALDALRGSDFLVQAGDIGSPNILAMLTDVAPLTAVRGNNDVAEWAVGFPVLNTLSLGALRLQADARTTASRST